MAHGSEVYRARWAAAMDRCGSDGRLTRPPPTMSRMSDGLSGPGDRPRAGAVRPSDGVGRASDGERRVPRVVQAGSRGAGLAYGGLAAGVLALVLFLAAAVFAFSASLVVIALFGGRIVGLSVRSGTLGASTPVGRTATALLLTLLALTLALVATWAAARLAGGVLDAPTYLLDTLGPVVPLAYLLGALGAWWGAG